MEWVLYIAGVAKLMFVGHQAAAACMAAQQAVEAAFGSSAAACVLTVAI